MDDANLLRRPDGRRRARRVGAFFDTRCSWCMDMTGSWIWSGIAAYLAHRGWESWAPSFEGEAAGGRSIVWPSSWSSVEPYQPACAPAHDAGVVIAAKLARELRRSRHRRHAAPGASTRKLLGFAHPQFWSRAFLVIACSLLEAGRRV